MPSSPRDAGAGGGVAPPAGAPGRWLASDPVAVLVLIALTIHAAAGEPTPDRAAVAPVLTAALLVLGLGGPLLAGSRGASPGAPAIRRAPPWSAASLAVLLLGLGAGPLLVGALRGWPAAETARDLVGLGALAAPVVLYAAVAGRADPAGASDRLADAVAAGLVLVGVGHAVRFLALVDLPPGTLGVAGGADGGRYLAGGPAIVFAAARLGGLVLTAVARSARPALGPASGGGPAGSLAVAAAAAAAAVPCFLALAMTLQRAALAAVALALLAGALRRLPRRPAAAVLGLTAGGLGLAAAPGLWRLGRALVDKTREVGANHRAEEVAAVADLLAEGPAAALFGQGWGALVALPAIGDAPVSFVHVLPLYLAWKTGLAGLALASAWLILVLRPIPRLVRRRPEETAAVIAALAVATTVQPGFKTLSFALILSLPLLRATYDFR